MTPELLHYDWPGGREAMLRWGAGAATILLAPPLFEEANRTRAAMADVACRLAATGFSVALPDLPGQCESLLPTEQATLAGWRAAFAAAASTLAAPIHVVAWRAGALVDAEAEVASRWYLSPLSGAEALRDLRRTAAVSGDGSYAGNRLSDDLIAALEAAEPATLAPLRVARLESDARPADARLRGRPLWRAAEPGTDAALQEAVERDVIAWVTSCAG